MAKQFKGENEVDVEAVAHNKKVTRKRESMVMAEQKRRALKKKYQEQRKVPIMISPLYKPYFGDTMHVSINGMAIFVPCDGKSRMIAKVFAAEILARIKKIDTIIQKAQKMSDIPSNLETSPGEIKLI